MKRIEIYSYSDKRHTGNIDIENVDKMLEKHLCIILLRILEALGCEIRETGYPSAHEYKTKTMCK